MRDMSQIRANSLLTCDQPAHNEVGPHIWKWLPKALQDGSYKAKPDPISAGKGLKSVQGGLKMNKDGVSGKKVVITL